MYIGKICADKVITLSQHASVFEAAALMKEYHLSNVVIIEGADSSRNPVGLLSPTDIVSNVIVNKLDAKYVHVSEIMNSRVLILREDIMVREVLHLMSSNKVHCCVILNKEGTIKGFATCNDLIVFLANEFSELAMISQYQFDA